ncbi:fluoride efflux transporter CrcB [Alicyclobacillus ferrooxydans]|uniref:Fluoride-specific ion channel FluC n=1 Tax=Alicyclobacillus ferrooxydans TaxID=471514 RepID=A0A0P9ELC7_9BACL|nr:fluoride efflux transporter CrcB [Alicyclobacillus ferrooxydans]KPV44046.1 hypothetical protein AN477_09070 [Alicyclobacillus ferrooxydans]
MNLIAIGVGGLIGGLFRYLVEVLVPTPMSLPLGTITVNLIGAMLLGLIYFVADERQWPSWLRLGLGTGMIGAFTTFSTFSLELSELVARHVGLAIAYGFVSIVGGVLFVMFGEWIGGLLLGGRVVAEQEVAS